MRISDWSSDVCSSDLATETVATLPGPAHAEAVDALVGLEVHDPQLVGQFLAVDEAAPEQVVAALADQRIGQRHFVDVRGPERLADLESTPEVVRPRRAAGAASKAWPPPPRHLSDDANGGSEG